ncbi:hypothetical protein PSAC2689_60002 [Paraburkholderia sacchari]
MAHHERRGSGVYARESAQKNQKTIKVRVSATMQEYPERNATPGAHRCDCFGLNRTRYGGSASAPK